jgi:hypothetical protein
VSGLFAAAGRVFAERDWPVTEMEDGSGFAVDVEGSDTAWTALVITDDDELVYLFYSISPVDVPPDKLDRASEFVDRANHGMVTAAFELDRDAGEVRLRTCLELATLPPQYVSDDAFLEAIVLDLAAANIGIFDRYVTGLVATVTGDVPVTDIIREIEG